MLNILSKLHDAHRNLLKSARHTIQEAIVRNEDESFRMNVFEFEEDMKRAGIEEKDLAQLLETYKLRCEERARVDKMPELQQAAQRAEHSTIEFEKMMWSAHRENQLRLTQLREQQYAAQTAYERSIEAKSFLLATSADPDGQAELAEQRRKLARREEELTRHHLNKNAPRPSAGWQFTARENPAALIGDCERKLVEIADNLKRGVSPEAMAEQRARVMRTIEVAREAVAKFEEELAQVRAEREAISQQIAEQDLQRLDPRNFRVVKTKPPLFSKEKAIAMNMHPHLYPASVAHLNMD